VRIDAGIDIVTADSDSAVATGADSRLINTHQYNAHSPLANINLKTKSRVLFNKAKSTLFAVFKASSGKCYAFESVTSSPIVSAIKPLLAAKYRAAHRMQTLDDDSRQCDHDDIVLGTA
jgi:hypothetical protein